MLVLAFDFESKRGREVFFISKHYINERRQFAIHRHGFLLTANRLPERFAIVEIVRHDAAVFSRNLHRFTSDSRRRFRQSAKDATRMKPTRTFHAEYLFPIDLAGLQL